MTQIEQQAIVIIEKLIEDGIALRATLSSVAIGSNTTALQAARQFLSMVAGRTERMSARKHDQILEVLHQLTLKMDKISERINLIEDAIVNDDTSSLLSDIKEIVDATEGKVYDIWKKENNND